MADTYAEFARLYDLLMDDVDYGLWTDSVLSLLAKMGIPPADGSLVLECACGTGNITAGLHRAGYKLVASDLSQEMLGEAQRKTRAMGLSIQFVRQDMRALSVHKKADAVVCCCDGANYLTSQRDLNDFFHSAASALKPGGALLFDVSSEYKLSRVLGSHVFSEDRKECTYIWQNHYDAVSRLVEMKLTFFLPEGRGTYTRFDETHLQRAHRPEEILRGLEQNGFDTICAYDAFTEEPPRADSERIQWTARHV